MLCLTAPAQALTLEFPGQAAMTITQQESDASYRLPVGPWVDGTVPTRLLQGVVDQTAWRITAADVGTLGLLRPLREQLLRDGWTVIFECETVACGGYDFRYGMAVLTEPDMHVDLGDFRYLAAERGGEVIGLLVSRSAVSGFVQLTRVGGVAAEPVGQVTTSTKAPSAEVAVVRPQSGASNPFGQQLEAGGAVVLEDLVFASGAAALADGNYASLADLAAYLAAHPDRQVALVGHTDASGSLAANVALSRKRAQSVRSRLIADYDVPPAQVQADGVGYLAPRASNLSPVGRTQNRRVEVMLTSTQ